MAMDGPFKIQVLELADRSVDIRSYIAQCKAWAQDRVDLDKKIFRWYPESKAFLPVEDSLDWRTLDHVAMDLSDLAEELAAMVQDPDPASISLTALEQIIKAYPKIYRKIDKASLDLPDSLPLYALRAVNRQISELAQELMEYLEEETVLGRG